MNADVNMLEIVVQHNAQTIRPASPEILLVPCSDVSYGRRMLTITLRSERHTPRDIEHNPTEQYTTPGYD